MGCKYPQHKNQSQPRLLRLNTRRQIVQRPIWRDTEGLREAYTADACHATKPFLEASGPLWRGRGRVMWGHGVLSAKSICADAVFKLFILCVHENSQLIVSFYLMI